LRRLALQAFAALALVTVAINAGVRWVSPGGPFWLDPRHLVNKARALVDYAAHRAGCATFSDDADVTRSALAAAAAAHVDPALFLAMVQTESSAQAHRISPTGAMGPAQLTAPTARMLGVRDPFDPVESTRGGARYLHQLLARFGGDRVLAVAAYNAGPHAVHGRVPHNGETEIYVARVMARYSALRLKDRAAPPAPPHT